MSTLVAYTDGSANPNPGFTGYGVHAYITDEEQKPKNVLTKYTVTNRGYYDKALLATNTDTNIKPIGIKRIFDLYGYNNDSITNNTAETDAVIELLRFVTNDNFKDVIGDIQTLVINIDSKVVLAGIDKILSGKVKDIIANNEYFVIMEKLIDKLKESKIELIPKKVKGHSNNLGNDRADMLSNMGRYINIKKGKQFNIIIEDRNTYWGNRIDRDPILNNTLIFEHSLKDIELDSTINICMVNYKDETDIGKAGNDIIYTVAVLKNDKPELSLISSLVREITGDIDIPYVFNLNNIYNKEVYNNIRLYGKDYLIMDDRVIRKIDTVDNIRIAQEIAPPGVSFKAIIKHNRLANMIDNYINNDLKNDNIDLVDITSSLYGKDEKDRPILLKELVNDKLSLKIDVSKHVPYNRKLTIRLKMDLPKRNTLKRFEKLNPKVYLILEKVYRPINGEKVMSLFTYKTLIEYGNEDKRYILTDNVYASTIMIMPKKVKKK